MDGSLKIRIAKVIAIPPVMIAEATRPVSTDNKNGVSGLVFVKVRAECVVMPSPMSDGSGGSGLPINHCFSL